MTKGAQEEILLSSRRFRVEREADWRRLEELLDRVTSRSARVLTDAELLELPRAYRATLSALSVARATSLDQSMIDYLESLSTRAYYFIYGSRSTAGDRIAAFFLNDWPKSVRAIGRETLVAIAVSIAAAIVAYVLVMSDPDWFYSFIPEQFNDGRNPAATTEDLRRTLYHDGDESGLSTFATFLFTHNARVALFAFALGFAFCLPTIFLLAYNGLILGAFIALYAGRGLGFELGGWLLIHGVTELFAIMIAGAAGLRIGWALANPGDVTRLAAAAAASRRVAPAVIGVVIMLLVAGLLEGFGRQLITSDTLRYVVAATSGAVWISYFYFSGERKPS